MVLCPGCSKPFPLPSAPAPPTVLARRPTRPKTQLAPPKEPRPMPSRVAPQRPELRRPPQSLPEPRRQVNRLVFAALAVLWMGLLGLAAYLVMSRFVNRDLRAADWTIFSPDGRCQVQMPGMPMRQTAVAHGPGLIGAQTFVREMPNQVFILSFSDRSEEAMKEAGFDGFYTAERNYVLRSRKGTLTQETDISRVGQPGKEFRVEPEAGGIVVARVYLVPGPESGRLYIVLYGGESWPPDGGDAITFLDSFTINPGTPVAAN
jgi:hypothetical protein